MPPSLNAFIAKWKGSAGSEEANSQSFLQDFCAAMDLPAVDAKGFDSAYCFEKKILLTHAEGRTSTGSADRRSNAAQYWSPPDGPCSRERSR